MLPDKVIIDSDEILNNNFDIHNDDRLPSQIEEYLSSVCGCRVNGFSYDIGWNEQFPDQPVEIIITDIEWDDGVEEVEECQQQ